MSSSLTMDDNRNPAPNGDVDQQPFITNPETTTPIKFGWGKFRPKWLQFLNNPKGFIVCLIAYTFFQAICVMGLLSLILPSIEKRFGLSGKEMGLIAAANDISALVLAVFISYYGDYGNKIRWIGGGGIVMSIGALLFALPHVLIGKYKPSHTGSMGGLCDSNQTTCNMESDSRWYYLFIFFVAQVVIGAGVSPLYSLVPAYLDENVHPKSMPVYLGIWQCSIFTGPGVGMAVAGKFLSIYVDIDQPAGIYLTTDDPRWIGAWWLGFVIFGFAVLACSLFLLGFPRELPGARALRQVQIAKGNLRKTDSITKPSLKNILPELKLVLTNWTFLFNTLGSTSTILFYGAIGPFYAKIMQLKFGIKPDDTGYALAVIITPTMFVGVLGGAIIIKKCSLKDICKKAALCILVFRMIGIVSPLSFLIPGCHNVELAKMGPSSSETVSRNSTPISSLPTSLLNDSCNANCGCSLSRFEPVCGTDNLTYFDACHAGCLSRVTKKEFANCSCIAPNGPGSQFGTVKSGYCDRDCKNFLIFSILIAISVMVQFANVIPNRTVNLRCVPDNKRAFATGMKYFFSKALGFFPGPIIFGHVVDASCQLWQDTCGEKGRCFVYDIDSLSTTILAFGVTITVVSTFFYFLSWYLYKPDVEEDLLTDREAVPEKPGNPNCNDTKV